MTYRVNPEKVYAIYLLHGEDCRSLWGIASTRKEAVEECRRVQMMECIGSAQVYIVEYGEQNTILCL